MTQRCKMVEVKVKRLSPGAIIPQFQHEGDACADLCACYGDVFLTIKPKHCALVSTGIAMEIPEGFEAQIRSRSGLAAKNGIVVFNSPGTIDSGYRGEIKVNLYNNSQIDWVVYSGLRIAQIAVRPIPKVNFIPVHELTGTDRGEGGFGSTGMV